MPRSMLLAGLELGSRHFVLTVGSLNEGQQLIVRTIEEIESHGFERGVLSQPVECTDTVARLVRQAEKTISAKITKAYVAVHGTHLKSFNATTSIPIADPTVGISRRDVERAVNNCKTFSLDYDRQIVHTFERGFSVDGQSGIKDPVGLAGTKLAVELHLVTAHTIAMQNLNKVLQRAGVEVEEFVLPAFACAEAVLLDVDRDLGVTLIHFGEFHTEAIIFTDGLVRETFLIPMGMDQLIEDLGRTLKLPGTGVEQLLEQVATLEEEIDRPNVPVRVRTGSIDRAFPHKEIIHLVRDRIKDLLMRVQQRLNESSYFHESASGITVVGSCARLEGFVEMAEEILNMPVKPGTPREIQLDPQISLSSLHIPAVGLLRYAAKRKVLPAGVTYSSPWLGWVEKTRKILEEYF